MVSVLANKFLRRELNHMNNAFSSQLLPRELYHEQCFKIQLSSFKQQTSNLKPETGLDTSIQVHLAKNLEFEI